MNNRHRSSIEKGFGNGPKKPLFLEALLDKWLSRIETGELKVFFPSSFQKVYSGTKVGPVADIQINSWKLIPRLLLSGDMGLAGSYLNGEWDTSNLTQLMLLGDINEKALGDTVTPLKAVRLIERLRHKRRNNSKQGSKRNIAAHYDLSNGFFALFLDKSMMYSSAIYPDENSSLDEAAEYKVECICQKLDLKASDHVLEIGTGWGGFAIHASQHYGCRVTTTTISNEQYALATERIQARFAWYCRHPSLIYERNTLCSVPTASRGTARALPAG